MSDPLKPQIEKFLKDVAKGKYGESKLTQDDVKKFQKRASKEDLEEFSDDYFWPWTSKLADENDWNVPELEEFVNSIIE